MNWIKTQWNRFRKWLWLLIIPVALASGIGEGVKDIPAITLENGRVIEFPYTDSLDNETIHIYTDRSHYDQNVTQAEVYFAIIVNKKQEIDFSVLLDGEVSDFEWLTLRTRTIETPIYEKTCSMVATTTATSTEPIEYEVCTSELVRTDISYEDYYSPDSRVFTEKQEDKKKYEITENLKKGVHYGRFIIPIEKGTDNEEFWLMAVDEDGKVSILDPWFSSSWTYRKKIEIDSSKVTATQSSFPVYVDLSDMGSNFFDNAKADGCDIRIVESDDTTETAFELVSYATTTSTGELHFMADSLSSSATTTFYMYYGNSGASCYAVDATYGSQNVWSDYDAVYHLTSLVDSTGNGINLTNKNSVVFQAGKIGNCSNSGTDNDTASDAQTKALWNTNNPPLSGGLSGSYTVQYWSYYNDKDGDYNWCIEDGGANDRGIRSVNEVWSPANSTPLSLGTINTGIWYFHHLVKDSSNLETFLNGYSADTGTYVDALTTTRDGFVLHAVDGNNPRVGANIRFDEWRARKSVLPSTWITTENNNQSSPSTFYAIATQETESAEDEAVTPPALPHYWDI